MAWDKSNFESSEEICEALVRHLETSGEEVLEKNFIKNDKVQCTVFCVIGENAERFNKAARQWLERNGFESTD